MDHLDPKQLGFVIYLVLRIHQFQKYHLLRKLHVWEFFLPRLNIRVYHKSDLMDHSIHDFLQKPISHFYPKPLNMIFYKVAELKATIWCSKKGEI
jgi:hypothetical protein